MKNFNKTIGRIGEELAAAHLAAKGYRILERNFANRFGEIDIIARDGEKLVFVEVKCKAGPLYGLPEEMVSPGKLRKVRNMANVYTGGKELPCRLDVVAVVLKADNTVERLTHYENVY